MDKSIVFDDVADIYDYYVQTDIDIPFFMKEFARSKEDVLELMCGTGRVSLPLLESGIAMTCVDYSSKMLMKFREKLRSRNLRASLVEADIRFLNLDRQFAAIFIPFHSFMELVGEHNQMAALNVIHKHLADGGTFICTLHNPVQRIRWANGGKDYAGRF
jgi:SAM-dependent methyltransferase